MMVKKYGLLVIILFFVILADSIYLTDVLTRFTVNSMLQYTFVLLYFFLLFSIIFCFTVIKIKKETSRSSYRKKLLFSVISAAILLVLGNSMLVNHLYKPSTLEIVASGEKMLNLNQQKYGLPTFLLMEIKLISIICLGVVVGK